MLMSAKIFTQNSANMSRREVIKNKEIAMSKIVLNHGKNIGCRLSRYAGADFRRAVAAPAGDLMRQGFMGKEWTPEDLIFIKSNRVCLR